MTKKPIVSFICVRNSCRSQIADALGRALASDVFESVSAGTLVKDSINPAAARIMKARYGINMESTQRSKLADAIPAPDVAISMGCGVACPCVGRPFDDDWGLEDPSDKENAVFQRVIDGCERKILELKENLRRRGADSFREKIALSHFR